MNAFLAGLVAGYGIAVPVGAIAVLVASLSARSSLRVGAAAGLGAATADGVYAGVAVLGGAALAQVVAPVTVPLRWLAAAVLLAMAVQTARSGLRRPTGAASEPDRMSPWRAYLSVLLLTLLNPATVVYFAALVLGRSGDVAGWPFVVGAFVASASWQLLVAGGGSLVGRVLTGPRGRTVTALVSSVTIGVLAVALVW